MGRDGDSDEDVAQLQTQLIGLGYRLEDPARLYGPSTAAGVRDFQRDRGLHPDGVCGSVTAQELHRVITLVNSPRGGFLTSEPGEFSASRQFAVVYPEAVDIAALIASAAWRYLAAGDAATTAAVHRRIHSTREGQPVSCDDGRVRSRTATIHAQA